jgi:hypothetical protein
MKILYGLIICFFTISTSVAQTSLSLNLIQGREYRQVMNGKIAMTQNFNGQEINVKMVIKGNIVYLVKSVNATSFDMDVKYESVGMEMQLPQGTMKFSSENPSEQDVFSQVLAGMINKPFQLQIAKNGKINFVKNIESLFTAAFEKFTQLSEAQKEQIKSQLLQTYGDKAFANNIEMSTAIFPDKPVTIGETWVVETKIETAMAANIRTTYKFIEDKPEYRQIHGDAVITSANKGEYTMTNGMEMKFDVQGSMVSDIKVDRTTGWILEANIVQNLTGNAHIKGNDQMPEGMTMPMTIKTEILNTGN